MPGKALMMILFTGWRDKSNRNLIIAGLNVMAAEVAQGSVISVLAG